MLQVLYSPFWQQEPVRIALIGAAVATVAVIIAFLTFLVQRRQAKDQIRVAERTMFLSLIDRRSRWLDDGLSHWEAWTNEQEKMVEDIVAGKELKRSDVLPHLAVNRRQAHWLFGSEVVAQLDLIEDCVRRYASARLKIREWDRQAQTPEAQAAWRDQHERLSGALITVIRERSKLLDLLIPYLDVSDLKREKSVVRGRKPKAKDAPDQLDCYS